MNAIKWRNGEWIEIPIYVGRYGHRRRLYVGYYSLKIISFYAIYGEQVEEGR